MSHIITQSGNKMIIWKPVVSIVFWLLISKLNFGMGENDLRLMDFKDCGKTVYNIYDTGGYRLEWSADSSTKYTTYTCRFHGYDDDYQVCIKAVLWDIEYENTFYPDYGDHAPPDITMEYYTYSPFENSKVDGFRSRIIETFSSFYESDPTVEWCQGQPDPADEHVAIKLDTMKGSPKRRIVLSVTGDKLPSDNFMLYLGLGIGSAMLITAIICTCVIVTVYRNHKRSMERFSCPPDNLRREATTDNSNNRRTSTNSRQTPPAPNESGANRTHSTSLENLYNFNDSNRRTPTAPNVSDMDEDEDPSAPPPLYDEVVSPGGNDQQHAPGDMEAKDPPTCPPPTYDAVVQSRMKQTTFV